MRELGPEEAAMSTRRADGAPAPGAAREPDAAEPAGSVAASASLTSPASGTDPVRPPPITSPFEQEEIPLERSLPGPSFTAEAEFAREREAVLFADWFCVGRQESLAGPGDYLTADVAGES